MHDIAVIKLDIDQRETWRYSGKVIARGKNYITIEAHFNRPDMPLHGILLGEGDRFLETFFTDKWFNVFAIHDREDGLFKGLYCNVSYPAEIGNGEVSYIDLALDLLVYPDGRQLILDQDEFDQLPISSEVKLRAEAALKELIGYSAGILPAYNQ